MNIKISIIIVTYNSQNYIEDCLTSIERFLDVAPSEVEVIIVDNSSGNDASEMKTISGNHHLNKVLNVRYIQNFANLGYGQGNNVGIRAALGEILCIMNPDVRFLEPLLFDVLSEFENKDIAMLSYKEKGGSGNSYYMKPEFKSFISGWELKLRNKFDQFNPKKHYLSGSFLFLDKSKFDKIGLFDENIFLYYEEPDIMRRLQMNGGKIKYKKEKKYLHLVGDRTVFSENAFTNEIKALKYYLKKFKFNEDKIIRNYLQEYKIKTFAAIVLNDKIRLEKFKKEIKIIKNIFSK